MVKIFFDKPVKQIKKIADHFYLNDTLKTNLDIIKKASTLDWDFIFIVDGIEGAGKSVFTQQLAYYLDPTLDISRICFSGEEFIEACINAKKYQAVIYDEAITGANIRQAMNDVNVDVMKMMGMIRQKNLYIFIVIPSFFDLDRYIALWRSRAVFHVFAKSYNDRGHFYCYKDRKNFMWIKYRKYFYYSDKLKDFRGNFTNVYCVEENAYRDKKATTLLNINNDPKEDKLKDMMKQRNEVICKMYIDKRYTAREIAELHKITTQRIYAITTSNQ